MSVAKPILGTCKLKDTEEELTALGKLIVLFFFPHKRKLIILIHLELSLAKACFVHLQVKESQEEIACLLWP